MTAQVVTRTNRRRGLAAAAAALLLIVPAACSDDSSSTGTSATSTTTQTGSPNAGADAQIDPGVADRLDEAIEKTMSMAAIPGAIVGVWGPDGNYVKAFGVADKTTGAPM